MQQLKQKFKVPQNVETRVQGSKKMLKQKLKVPKKLKQKFTKKSG